MEYAVAILGFFGTIILLTKLFKNQNFVTGVGLIIAFFILMFGIIMIWQKNKIEEYKKDSGVVF